MNAPRKSGERSPRKPDSGRTHIRETRHAAGGHSERDRKDHRKDRKDTSRKRESHQRTQTKTVAVRETRAGMRLNKFLAEAEVTSRRKADELISNGAVKVNGRVVTELGARIDPASDRVLVHGAEVHLTPQLVYILLNKPKDCITTTSDERARNTVMDIVPERPRVYPVGRLDRNTTGALLLTNDGDLAFGLTHPKFHVPKAYRVELDRKVSPRDIERLRRGIRLADGMTAPCDAEVLNPPQSNLVGLVLYEGRNRQVRRMFEALGCGVKKLERTVYGGLSTEGMKRGEWRYLSAREVTRLRAMLREAAHTPRDEEE